MADSINIVPNNPSILGIEKIKLTLDIENATYQWAVDGTNVSGANEATYILDKQAVGEFEVKIYYSDDDGDLTDTIIVTVYSEYSLLDEVEALLTAIKKAMA
jgi:hypothetical protein